MLPSLSEKNMNNAFTYDLCVSFSMGNIVWLILAAFEVFLKQYKVAFVTFVQRRHLSLDTDPLCKKMFSHDMSCVNYGYL